jgi:hypothetical protein
MANTKALKVMSNRNGPHFVIGWDKGGEVPLELSGLYTNAGLAEQAIYNYVKSKEKPAKITAKAS